jgi:hypothetical protein
MERTCDMPAQRSFQLVGRPACLQAPSLRCVSFVLDMPPACLRAKLVRTVGIEPTLPIGKKILSLQRLPFRHVR